MDEMLPEARRTRTAGGVVLNQRGEVLVTSQRGTSWSLPKGHVEEGEDDLTTAKREIEEETGVRNLTLIKKLDSYIRYKIGKDGIGEDTSDLKEMFMFLFTTEDEELVPTDIEHNPEARWVSIEEVSRMLTHPKDKEYFESCIPKLHKEIAERTKT
jgi:8-oxo-dGTP pyrophosphatase MutT (NUDIX family)